MVLTKDLLGRQEISDLVARGKTRCLYRQDSDGSYQPNVKGKPLRAGEVIRARTAPWEVKRGEAFAKEHVATFERLLTDNPGRKVGRWLFHVDEIAFYGSRYANAGDSGPGRPLATTGEKRLSEVNKYFFDTSAKLNIEYDGPAVTWVTGLEAGFEIKDLKLWDRLSLCSDLKFRYLAPDADDRRRTMADLEFTGDISLELALVGGLRFVVQADLYFVNTRIDDSWTLGGSYVLKAGLKFIDSFWLN